MWGLRARRLLTSAVNRSILPFVRHSNSSSGGGSTVFALSSGRGRCGVAVLRVSGPRAARALQALCPSQSLLQPRKAVLKTLFRPDTGEVLDRGLVLWFPAPSSFTGEDCLELQVHGSPAVVAALLEALGSMEGLRPAEPGEFTRRAFLAGKMDLAQIEGLGDLIHAETEQQRKQAIRQMDGSLSKAQKRWRSEIVKLAASLEAYIDFGESDDIESGVMSGVLAGASRLLSEFDLHLSSAIAGDRLRCGVRVAVVGAPNAGKSSLLNMLAGRDAAIVSPGEGTTRDVLEAPLDVGGYPVVVVDTAGLRSGGQDEDIDPVEQEGIRRAVKNALEADLVIFVVDASQHTSRVTDPEHLQKTVSETLDEFDLSDLSQSENLLVFVNKIDLIAESAPPASVNDKTAFLSCLVDGMASSALELLRREVSRLCQTEGGGSSLDAPVLTRARHVAHLKKARGHLHSFLEEPSGDLALDAQELRLAVREIGCISGAAVTSEQILDSIFADFCIGK